MLKIKEDVDLKELIKMGFNHTKGTLVYQYQAVVDYKTISPLGIVKVSIHFLSTDRILKIRCDDEMEYTEIDILYDLIKADLVEKVGD